MSDLIPAATVVLLRPAADGFETLMLRKTTGQSFGGMWVFPGGRVEPTDGPPGAPEQVAAQHAAIREAAEETGVVLDGAELIPIAHWVPPEGRMRRYATWFFVAALPDGAAEVVVDGGEIGDHVWTTPRGVLDRHAAGDVELAPPTWITLHRLLDAPSIEAALEAARVGQVRRHATRIMADGDVLVSVWPPDAAYDTGDLAEPGPRNRLRMQLGGWVYESGDRSDV